MLRQHQFSGYLVLARSASEGAARKTGRSRSRRATRKRTCAGALGASLLLLVACRGDPSPSDASARPLAIVVSGDTAGWIVPCGCASNQSGGLLRRGAYVKRLRRDYDIVLADVGGAPGGTSDYQKVKFEAILAGERAMGIAAHNIGGPEAKLGAAYLRTLGGHRGVPFVSANVRDAAGELIAPAIRVVEAAGRRIGLTGVLSPALAAAGLTVGDPRETLLSVIDRARGDYDALVVLAYLPEDELRILAAALPEADVVVGGPTGQNLAPAAVGPTLLVSATNKAKFLVQLEPASQGHTFSARSVEMGDDLPDDPGQRENLARYLAALESRDFPATETGLVGVRSEYPAGYRLAGTDACRECHENDCGQWGDSRHARAWPTLEERGKHVDPYCQQCHTDGYAFPGGFVSARRTVDRVNVGCESCHGPSLAHARAPSTKTPFDAADQCVRCHDRENSPAFDYPVYWSRMIHGQAPAAVHAQDGSEEQP